MNNELRIKNIIIPNSITIFDLLFIIYQKLKKLKTPPPKAEGSLVRGTDPINSVYSSRLGLDLTRDIH